MQRLSLLLIEDDRADALLVEELLADVAVDVELVWVQSLAQAQRAVSAARPDCILLDLNLPDAEGFQAIDRIRSYDVTVPVIVLTGLHGEHIGVSAVASGAQDYLVKGSVEAELLWRAVRYAIERKRAELTAAELQASQLQASEAARLERRLLTTPLLLTDPGIDIVARYQPCRDNGFLGGDFYDIVQTPDRDVHVVIGDVAGHGPEEAALGIALRITWRALTFAGLRGAERIRQLERMLRAERVDKQTFATVLSLDIASASRHITAVCAGHPGMLLHGGGLVQWVEPSRGPALGIGGGDWTTQHIQLPVGNGLVLFTDGLFEGHAGRGNERLGEAGLLQMAQALADLPGPAFVDALIAQAEQRAYEHGGFNDDVAVLRVEQTPALRSPNVLGGSSTPTECGSTTLGTVRPSP